MSLSDRSAAELSQDWLRAAFTSRELTQDCLDQIAHHDATIGAFLLVDHEGALRRRRSRTSDARREQPLSSLDGLPVALKDVLCTAGQRPRAVPACWPISSPPTTPRWSPGSARPGRF